MMKNATWLVLSAILFGLAAEDVGEERRYDFPQFQVRNILFLLICVYKGLGKCL